MSNYYEDPPRWTDARWVWAAIAAVCAIALLGNLAVWLLLRDSDPTSSSASAETQQGQGQPGGASGQDFSPETSEQDPDAASPVARCQARWQQQRQPLQAAQSSLRQWRVHVQAMNQLVAGDISASQATTFWNQTRMGAMHNIMRFEQDRSRYESKAPECGSGDLDTSEGQATPTDRDCIRAAMAGDRLLSAAGTAITTWKHHVHHMEMLRDGQMTADQAAQMWLMSWRAGQRELVEYSRASMQTLYLRCS
jgi:hypothetical protein